MSTQNSALKRPHKTASIVFTNAYMLAHGTAGGAHLAVAAVWMPLLGARQIQRLKHLALRVLLLHDHLDLPAATPHRRDG